MTFLFPRRLGNPESAQNFPQTSHRLPRDLHIMLDDPKCYQMIPDDSDDPNGTSEFDVVNYATGQKN